MCQPAAAPVPPSRLTFPWIGSLIVATFDDRGVIPFRPQVSVSGRRFVPRWASNVPAGKASSAATHEWIGRPSEVGVGGTVPTYPGAAPTCSSRVRKVAVVDPAGGGEAFHVRSAVIERG